MNLIFYFNHLRLISNISNLDFSCGVYCERKPTFNIGYCTISSTDFHNTRSNDILTGDICNNTCNSFFSVPLHM